MRLLSSNTHVSLLRAARPALFVALPFAGFAACSAPPSDGDDVSPDTSADVAPDSDRDDGDGGDLDADLDGDIGDDGSGGTGGKPIAQIEETLPKNFIANTYGVAGQTPMGGYYIAGPLAEYTNPRANSCANVLSAVIRDFKQAHVDFGQEKPASWAADGKNGLYTGLVESVIGEGRKPVLSAGYVPSDVIEHFSDWYENTPGVNVPYAMEFWLEPNPAKPGFFTFNANDFFPLEEEPYKDAADSQVGGENANGPKNFLFTIEMHTAFEYKGGEVFTFQGDDDVWVFINERLAVDIGGIHGWIERSVDLDERAAELGLEKGKVYELDLFQAERNPGGSNFAIDTSLDFQACGVLPGDVN